ncbi:MAG: hypothetical protein ACK5QT_06500 [Oligoflexia bacterium]
MRFFFGLSALLWGSTLFAQTPSVGMGWLLNPEGSRLFPQTVIFPRHPGKPDPRWKVFDWHYRDFQTEGATWRLYFYDVGNGTRSFWTAEFAAPIIERQIRELAREFAFQPKNPFSYLLFSSYREFQQANVFFIDEGVQGVTSTLEPTMAIPYWGERETFRHISHHELVHQFQVQKMGISEGLLIPLWLIEGMAEYYSLGGIDAESLALLRDLYFNPPQGRTLKESRQELEDYLNPGPYDFQHVYKLGQLKVSFLDETYGKGSVQRVFSICASQLGKPETPDFAAALLQGTRQTGRAVETLTEFQAKWKEYLARKLEHGMTGATSLEGYSKIESVGDTLDLYALSPSGEAVFWRQVDPLTGSASLWLGSVDRPKQRTQIIRDRQNSAVSLYFLQVPSIALGDKSLAFIASTAQGPELELRSYELSQTTEPKTGPGGRIPLHEFGLVQAHSPAYDPDERRLAFVGINSKGWQNIYVLDPSPRNQKPTLRQLTEGAFSWKHLHWTRRGILASSDQDSAAGLYGIVLLDPGSLKFRALVIPGLGHENLLEPVAAPDGDPTEELILRSTNRNGSQIYRWTRTRGLQPLTHSRTQMTQPQLTRRGLTALGFERSRYRVVKLPQRRPAASGPVKTWDATEVTPFEPRTIKRYRPFSDSGLRLEDVGAFFSSGAVLGAAATVSDLMRNQIISADFFAISGQGLTQANAFFTSQEGRATWTLGAYHQRNLRLDSSLVQGGSTALYRSDETGVLGAVQYPLGAYQYGSTVLRLARVQRADTLEGAEFLLGPSFSYGLDLIEYELFSGPIQGFGFLVETGTEWFPARGYANQRLRLDVARYFRLWGRSLLAVQGLAGASFNLTDPLTGGQDYRNPFYVSGDDLFRAYSFGDDRLRGNYLLGVKTELRFPIGEIIGFEPLRGLLAADAGSIWRRWDALSQQISRGATASWSTGFAFNIPPISFSFLFSHPLRVAPAPTPIESSVFHFTLRYLYL